MRNYTQIILGFLFLLPVLNSYAQFSYISPVPESKMHNKETNIILRTGDYVDAASLHPDLFSIEGSVSGVHTAKVKLAADKKTILIQPSVIFAGGETVTININDGIRNSGGGIVHGTNFQFQISVDRTADDQSLAAIEPGEFGWQKTLNGGSGDTRELPCDNLPAFVITSTPGAYYDQPVFYRNHGPQFITDCWRPTIITSQGDSIYSEYNNNVGIDFKLNDNGYLTYYNWLDTCFDMLDSSYNVVKKIYMGNGYDAEAHEFRIFPDGYRLMQCYDQQTTDMTAYGGLPNAKVTGLVIQKIDPDNNVIFEWRSWDHFQITDASSDISLTNLIVDYVHCNAMELDFDGNLLISSRHMDEITKIDISTGNIIWRMGGENNEFTFINDPDTPKPFSHQHHFRRLANGHYTLFDNGNLQVPLTSSAKEFVLDQINKTATLVWSYVHPPVNGYNIYGSGLGSVQVLPNGNRLIDWGQLYYVAFADQPNFTEVDSNGNIVWEFRFVDSMYVSYRIEKFPWDRCNLIAETSVIADSITTTSAHLNWNNHSKFSGFILEYKECGASVWINIPLDTNYYYLTGLQPNSCYDWRVQSICAIYNDSFYTTVHQFSTLNPVSVSETGNAEPLFKLYPNPATTEIELNFFSSSVCKAELTIYDLSGAMVSHRILSTQTGNNKWKINLQSLKAGMYTVKLKSRNAVQNRQLIIQ